MVRSATLTTVPSRKAMPEPSAAAAMTARPGRRAHPHSRRRRIHHVQKGSLLPCPLRYASSTELRLAEHVARLAEEHPPIQLDSVDFTVRDPREFEARFGHVLDYMARVELEVDRNVLELTTMLPDPPEIDRHFYADVWQPQEIQHGLILDQLQVELGREPAEADLDSIGLKLKVLGALAHLGPFQDVCRMLYYLTGMATERSAVLAYNLLHRGTLDMGEDAVAKTVIGQIKRQEPGHYAFYQLSARGLWAELAAWQRWMVRLHAPGRPSPRSAPTTPSRRPTSAT